MIFVIMGIERFPFDRLVSCIDSLVESGKIVDAVFIQLGSTTYEPRHCQWERFLSFDKMRENIEAATLIIAHAGAGTTLLCLTLGKKPILVPRKKEHKEHVDDHQVLFAKKMEELGYASVVWEVDRLINVIEIHSNNLESSPIAKPSQLNNYLETQVNSWRQLSARRNPWSRNLGGE